MAFELISGPGDDFQVEATVTAGVAIAKGDVLAVNGNVLERATASSTVHSVFGVAGETISTADTKIKVIPIVPNAQQIWKCDTTNNTASTQRYENAVLTDQATLNNTDSTVTGPTGIFTMLDFAGAAADKKAVGHFNKLSVTST
jgi:hypothetical protein